MEYDVDQDYWENHWVEIGGTGRGTMVDAPPNAHTVLELGGLDPRRPDGQSPGTALDAGCGAGAEAIWLAERGWRVTGADFSATALTHAARRAREAGVADAVTWVEADLCTWTPEHPIDLVTTHYAHPEMPQLDFYARIAGWVAPGGTLLIVGHRHTPPRPDDHAHNTHNTHDAHDDGPHTDDAHDDDTHTESPPPETLVSAAAVTALLDPELWEIVTAEQIDGTRVRHDGTVRPVHDVVVRAVRRR